MDSTEHSSFIETAMKHHSTSQAAIKSLQHQLECFEQIRNSTKEIFNLTQENEKALERSAKSLVLSTSRYLVDPASEQITPERHPLSSTLNKQDKVGDDSVIRNLLPSFEEIKQSGEPVVETYPFPITPIKSFSQSNIASATKDSLASGTLPPTPSSDAIPTSFAALNENSQSPSSKNFSVVAPSSGCMSLSDVLARLAYSSALNGTVSGLDSTGNTSDELIGLLEKISKTGEQLKMDLQDARLRESALIQEVRRLRGQQNGYRSNGEVKSPSTEVTTPYSEVIRLKCEKLEDALLSLQDENVKLNRRLKGTEVGNSSMNEHLQKKLLETKEENQLLREQLEKIANQLKKMDQFNEMSPEKDITSQQDQSASSVFEHKRQIRELEAENKSMTSRLNDLNLLLVEKDEKLQEFQNKIRAASDESRSSMSRCEDLEKKDVYKRKEVLLLCDKFEKLKKISKRMESELQEHKNKERCDVTRKWAVDDSLQKIAQENNKIRSKMNAELQMLTMDKVLLEKDYSLLKKRYETLLQRVTNDNNTSLGNTSNNSNQHTQSVTSRPRSMTSLGIREDVTMTTDSFVRASRSAADVHGPLTSTQRVPRHHHRRHTSPYEFPKPRNDITKQLLPENFEANTSKRQNSGAKKALLLTPPRGSQSAERSSLGRGSEYGSKRLSPLDVRQLAQSAYTDEYIKNMDGIGRMLSLSDHSIKPHERSGGSLQRADESATITGRNHQRSRTEPSSISFASRGFTSVASATKGESPYSDEYLRNVDGARWMAHAGGAKVGERSRSLSPGKSILKNAVEDLRKAKDQSSSIDLANNSSLAEKSSSWISSRYPAVSPPAKFRDRAARSSSAVDVANRSSAVSERSLHLSDLPCDRAGVYDKFRNFDSQLPASTLPLASDPPQVPRARHLEATGARFPPPLGGAVEARHLRSERMSPAVAAAKETRKPRDDDVTSTEQSSVSTVRDHVGRVEFLRQLQTNAGVRMPALMRDVTMNDDVIVDDDDIRDGEVHLGLSQKQQAYADKLVRKYTKTGGKKSRSK